MGSFSASMSSSPGPPQAEGKSENEAMEGIDALMGEVPVISRFLRYRRNVLRGFSKRLGFFSFPGLSGSSVFNYSFSLHSCPTSHLLLALLP